MITLRKDFWKTENGKIYREWKPGYMMEIDPGTETGRAVKEDPKYGKLELGFDLSGFESETELVVFCIKFFVG